MKTSNKLILITLALILIGLSGFIMNIKVNGYTAENNSLQLIPSFKHLKIEGFDFVDIQAVQEFHSDNDEMKFQNGLIRNNIEIVLDHDSINEVLTIKPLQKENDTKSQCIIKVNEGLMHTLSLTNVGLFQPGPSTFDSLNLIVKNSTVRYYLRNFKMSHLFVQAINSSIVMFGEIRTCEVSLDYSSLHMSDVYYISGSMRNGSTINGNVYVNDLKYLDKSSKIELNHHTNFMLNGTPLDSVGYIFFPGSRKETLFFEVEVPNERKHQFEEIKIATNPTYDTEFSANMFFFHREDEENNEKTPRIIDYNPLPYSIGPSIKANEIILVWIEMNLDSQSYSSYFKRIGMESPMAVSHNTPFKRPLNEFNFFWTTTHERTNSPYALIVKKIGLVDSAGSTTLINPNKELPL